MFGPSQDEHEPVPCRASTSLNHLCRYYSIRGIREKFIFNIHNRGTNPTNVCMVLPVDGAICCKHTAGASLIFHTTCKKMRGKRDVHNGDRGHCVWKKGRGHCDEGGTKRGRVTHSHTGEIRPTRSRAGAAGVPFF